MPNASPPSQPPRFDAGTMALFLDFDGTLVELMEHPAGVAVDAALAALLARLAARLPGRVALVSGRSVAQLEALVGALADDLALVGSHGAEIRAGPSGVRSPGRPAALDRVEAIVRAAIGHEAGIVIEVKTLGVAIHYRQNPGLEAAARRIAAEAAEAGDLIVQTGKMMVEIRTAGHDKGTAIATLMAQPPFAGHRPVFLGDDVTDEPGLAFCTEADGAGILVGPPRVTAAAYRLPDVAAARAWLAAL
ncbi:MAG: trehalose-phosphatase [Sphingomonas sp. 28-66-16]|nr:MAG: trehalose-phosphatase [Sphingomonas sp. 28-66-16]